MKVCIKGQDLKINITGFLLQIQGIILRLLLAPSLQKSIAKNPNLFNLIKHIPYNKPGVFSQLAEAAQDAGGIKRKGLSNPP
jgi:hypothetical protein